MWTRSLDARSNSGPHVGDRVRRSAARERSPGAPACSATRTMRRGSWRRAPLGLDRRGCEALLASAQRGIGAGRALARLTAADAASEADDDDGAVRGASGRDRQGGGRSGRVTVKALAALVARGPRAAGRRARRGQDSARQRARRALSGSTSVASSSRPTCSPPTSRGTMTLRGGELAFRPRPDIHQLPSRRRDQPHAAEDAGGAAGGDAGAPGHGRGPARSRCPTRSWSSPPRTRSSTRAPTRCPRHSSIASCSDRRRLPGRGRRSG